MPSRRRQTKELTTSHQSKMLSIVTRTLLVAAALTQTNAAHPHDGVKEACGCAKEEAEHPFAIDCADAATIRAATVPCRVRERGRGRT